MFNHKIINIKNVLRIFLYLILINLTLSNKLKVHLIPHSHQDVGWLCSYEEYFSGTGGCNINVSEIINNVLNSLSKNKNRTFVYSEMAFLKKWWKNANESQHEIFKNLTKENRLEILNGGLVMNDEASSYYDDIISQMRDGLIFLNNTLNIIPKTAWSIDPFGHSATNADILINLGFENLVIQRIDYKQKEQFRKEKKMEFDWFPFQSNLINNKSIFTHILYDDYCPVDFILPDFIHDIDIDLSEKNWFALAKRFYDYIIRTYGESYSENILFPFGCDFAFKNEKNFINMEKLMAIFSRNPKVFSKIELFYSTPKKYFHSVKLKHDLSNRTNNKSIINDDFLPYAFSESNYWTGFYSSRPYLKGFIRDAGNLLRSSSQFYHLIFTSPIERLNIYKRIVELREAISITQHHDAVTGTAKKHVVNDYLRILQEGMFNLKSVLSDSVSNSMMIPRENIKLINDNFLSDRNSTEFYLNFKEIGEKKMIVLFNRNNEGKRIFRMFSNHPYLKIISFTQEILNYEFIEIEREKIKFYIEKFSQFSENDKLFEIFIEIKLDLKNWMNIFLFTSENKKNVISFKQEISKIELNPYKKIQINDNEYLLYLNKTKFNYFRKSKSNTTNQTNVIFEISNKFYSHHDNLLNHTLNYFDATNPDEYTMSISSVEIEDYNKNLNEKWIYEGNLFTKINFEFENSLFNIVILKTDTDSILIENTIFPRKINTTLTENNFDFVGKEILFNIDTDINNTKLIYDEKYPNKELNEISFFTDSNGVNFMERISNYRKNFWLYSTDNVSTNYYPVNKFILINDNKNSSSSRSFFSFNERSQAGSSIYPGNTNFIVDRFSRNSLLEKGEVFIDDEIYGKYFSTKHWIHYSDDINYGNVRRIEKKIEESILIYIVEDSSLIKNSLVYLENVKDNKEFLQEENFRDKILEQFFEYDNLILKQNIYVIEENTILVTFFYDSLNEIFFKSDKMQIIKVLGDYSCKIFVTNLSGTFIIRAVEENDELTIRRGEYLTFKLLRFKL